MFEFRVTKYNPANRDRHGSYKRDEWTAFSDIGSTFDGVILTEPEYRRVEDAYATVAVAFLREGGVDALAVDGLENHGAVQLHFDEGSALNLMEIDAVLRRVLREEFWCRLVGADAFLHIGYDYYMYVGVPNPCPNADALAKQLGLFVEPFLSPYSEQRP